jgi:hypothetical protein
MARRISNRDAAMIDTFATILVGGAFYPLIGSWGIPIGFFASAVLLGSYYKHDTGAVTGWLLGLIAIVWNVNKVAHLTFWTGALVFLGALIVVAVARKTIGVVVKKAIDDRRSANRSQGEPPVAQADS